VQTTLPSLKQSVKQTPSTGKSSRINEHWCTFQGFQLMLYENNRTIPGNYRQHCLAAVQGKEKVKKRPHSPSLSIEKARLERSCLQIPNFGYSWRDTEKYKRHN